jgi:ubiquinone/menaquinone biosynthesis C-methylase UbiE
MNAFALSKLNLEPTDHVLEIGFGGGLTLSPLLEATAFVAGLDHSHDVIAWAKRRFSKHISSGRADFRQGDVGTIPFGASTFDKVCTINTVYFWTSLESGFAEIYRVSKPRGRVVIGFLPKERMDRMGMPEDIFRTRSPQEVVSAITKAGFRDVLIARPEPDTPWNVVVATR